MPSAFLQWLYADAADVPQTGYEVSRNSDPMSPKFTRPRNSASGSLVSVGAEGEEHSTDVMRIARPGELTDLASLGLGLTLAEGKRLLAGVQREVVAAQARVHAVHRPACRGCGASCRIKDYRQHALATL